MQNSTLNSTTQVPLLFKEASQDSRFLIIPLVVVVIIMLLSALVYLMAKKKRLDLVRENLMQLYEFDSYEQEWESLNVSVNEQNYGSLFSFTTTRV
ncbi:hypothetical protein FQR65_LT11065 [Abscondita terminalis]|nr:hypothetical protein FQR65_LT11065 [Abscondita terminalis]